MKTIRTLKYFYILIVAAVAFTACNDDNELGEVKVPGSDYTLPQGGNNEADAKIMSLYDTYGSYFLYVFSEKDFKWSLVENNGTEYQFEPIEPERVNNLLDIIQITWLDLYDTSFLKKNMPKFVMLTGKLQTLVEDWWSSSWVDVPARCIDNQIAISDITKNVGEMTSDDKRSFKNYLQAVFLNYCITTGAVEVPREFYTVSDYTAELYWESTEKAREYGFVYNPQTDEEWSTVYWSLSQSLDISAYVASLAYRTESEWTEDLEYPLVRKKYELLVNAFTKAGVDIKKIGNKDFK